jgi:hypothetical protein
MGYLRTTLVLLWCLSAALTARGNEPVIPSDSVELRSFDAERIAHYRTEPDLQYERELHREATPWERFKEWLENWLQTVVGESFSDLLSRNVVVVLCIVLLILALVVLGRGGIRRVLVGEPTKAAMVLPGTEDIRELDLESMIGEAEASGDLRRAIRLHYLWVLRKLVDRGVLRWSPDLTDHDYALQISDAGTRTSFTRIASIFQWVWYGDSPITQERYAELRTPFLEFEGPAAA